MPAAHDQTLAAALAVGTPDAMKPPSQYSPPPPGSAPPQLSAPPATPTAVSASSREGSAQVLPMAAQAACAAAQVRLAGTAA